MIISCSVHFCQTGYGYFPYNSLQNIVLCLMMVYSRRSLTKAWTRSALTTENLAYFKPKLFIEYLRQSSTLLTNREEAWFLRNAAINYNFFDWEPTICSVHLLQLMSKYLSRNWFAWFFFEKTKLNKIASHSCCRFVTVITTTELPTTTVPATTTELPTTGMFVAGLVCECQSAHTCFLH
jgi:hypothetical protein